MINLDTLQVETTKKKDRILYAVSLIVLFGGVLCLLIDFEFTARQSFFIKLPMFALIGTGLSFAVVFTSLDVLNYLFIYFRMKKGDPDSEKGLIESDRQILAVLYNCVFMGFIFGCIFGFLDVEDKRRFELLKTFSLDLNVTIPVGFGLGAIGGLYNELLRLNKVIHPKMTKLINWGHFVRAERVWNRETRVHTQRSI